MVKAALSDHVDCVGSAESQIWIMRDQDRYAEYLKDAFRRHKSLQKQDLALALGIPRSQVSEMLKGNRQIKAHEIRIIADFFGEPWPDYEHLSGTEPVPLATKRIPVLGVVAAGVWLEADLPGVAASTDQFAPVIPADLADDARGFALRIDGAHLNKLAPPGAYLLCDGIERDVADLADGDLVVIRQTLPAVNLTEVSARRVRRRGDVIELFCESTDPAFAGVLALPARDRRVVILGRVTWLVVRP